jgi:hypothetical protein
MEKTITKESLWSRVELATSRRDLDEVERDARSIGHSPDGILGRRIAEKRATMEA